MIQDLNELIALHYRYPKRPGARTPGAWMLDLLEDVVAPPIAVALALVVMVLGLAWLAWRLLTAALDAMIGMVLDAMRQLG